MNLRKLFALLTAAIMLLGMVPAGYAEGGNMLPGGEFTVSCNHDWAWRWPDGKPANCQDWKISEEYCTKCGMINDSFEQCGECQPGSWHWDGTPPANCNEWGIQNQSCSVCGEVFNEREVSGDHQWGGYTTVEPAGCETPGEEVSYCSVCGESGSSREIPAKGHDWGEWKWEVEGTCNQDGLRVRYCKRCNAREEDYVQGNDHDYGDWREETKPTCTEHGLESRKCSRCGDTQWRNKAQIDHVFDEWYVVAEPQVGLPGLEQRDCTYGCGTFEQREIPALEQDFSDDPVSAEGLNLTLVLSSSPANGTHFVVGEEVTFTETWVNNTDKTLYPFSVSIYTCVTPVFGSEIDQICSWFAEDYGGPVAPSATASHTLTVTVTENDVARGAIYAMAEILSTVQGGADLENVTAPFVTAPCGPDNSGDFGLVNSLTVTKQVTSTPANGSCYVPGETVTYEVCVKNNGEPLNDLDVSDWMWGDEHAWVGSFATGEAVIYPVTHIVTDADARAKHVNNIACATAVDKDGNQITEYSNLVTVPCGFPEGDDPFGIFHSLALVKKEESLPLNGEYYTEGEVIHYSITYTNDGELPLTDVQVWDNMDINTTIGHAEMLQPGESRICYYQHTVTAEDVAAGTVLNLAQANYPVPGGEGYIGVNSNLVFSKTSADGMHCVVLPPLFTESGEDPEYDPGTGWIDLIPVTPGGITPDGTTPDDVVPPFGTIDTDALHGGESYCIRTIIGRDNVSASYETTFCSVHSPMQSATLVMTQSAATPETQMQAAAYAVSLWRTEVQKLYQELCEAADSTAKTVVMTEYVRFLTEAANREAVLNLMYPGQPALVAQKVAAMWENKCIDLCYDMHADATERKDSLLAVMPTIGAVAESCSCEVTAQETGKKTEKQSYCPVHSFPFGMIDALLQGNDTVESWTMVRQIWGVELTGAYNKVYTAMGDNKLLAMAEYNTLTQWMMAREASLIALYPENPEVVAQIMVKTIMERVNELCAAVQ